MTGAEMQELHLKRGICPGSKGPIPGASQLLHKLQGHYTEIPQELRSDILAFYHNLDAPISTKTNGDDWARVIEELDHLRSVDMDLRWNSPKHAAVEAM